MRGLNLAVGAACLSMAMIGGGASAQVPSCPAPASEPQVSTACGQRVALGWTGGAGALSYRVTVDDQPDFSSPVVDAALVTAPSYSVMLVGAGPWYWKVVSYDNDSGSSTECDSPADFGSFTIDPSTFAPGQYVTEWTSHGVNNTSLNTFSHPLRSLAVERTSGRVYVQDSTSLYVYNSDGTLPSRFILSRPSGYIASSAGDIAATQEGGVITLYYVENLSFSRGTNRMVFKVRDTGASTLSPVWARGSNKSLKSALSATPVGVDSTDFYNLATDCSILGHDDPDVTGTQRFKSAHSTLGNFPGGNAAGVAVTSSGTIYVGQGGGSAAWSSPGCSTSSMTGRVEAMSSAGDFTGRYYRQSNSWQFHFSGDLPVASVAANNSYLFMSEYAVGSGANRIHRMSLTGTGGVTAATLGGTDGNPVYMSTGPDGRLYVAYFSGNNTSPNAGVWICDASGFGCQRKISTTGACSAGSDIIDPMDVEVDANGFIYVADRGAEETGHKRIVKFAPIP